MKADEAVKQYYLIPEQHAKFMTTHQTGNPDYDILSRELDSANVSHTQLPIFNSI